MVSSVVSTVVHWLVMRHDVVSTTSSAVERVDLISPDNTPDPSNDEGSKEALNESKDESSAVASSVVTAGTQESAEPWREDVDDEKTHTGSLIDVDHSIRAASVVFLALKNNCLRSLLNNNLWLRVSWWSLSVLSLLRIWLSWLLRWVRTWLLIALHDK